jgi:endoglucanase
VRFLNGAEGVVGYPAAGEDKKPANLEQLFIDPGTGAGIAVGDVAVFAGPFLEMGDCVAGKALDNRVGVAVLIECLRRLSEQAASPHELFFAFTAQEQPGQRGAGAAAFGVQPDVLLAIDVCDAGDTPGASGAGTALHLGQGPAIRVRDQMMLSRPAVVDWMTSAADAAKIPYQKEITTTSTSGASVAQISGEGAAAGALAIACRYRGSPAEVVHWSDVERLTGLLTQLLTGPLSL